MDLESTWRDCALWARDFKPDFKPSVVPGMVLGSLIDSGIVPVVRLTEVFRQAAHSRITEESAAYATPKAAAASPSPLQKGEGLGRGVARCRLSRGLGSITTAHRTNEGHMPEIPAKETNSISISSTRRSRSRLLPRSWIW